MKMTRRAFLVASAAAAAGAAGAEKTTDGGFAEVVPPGVPRRKHPVLPPGAGSDALFARRCVGCQLCVKACPNKVLRPSRGKNAPRPEMAFDKGWCRPECVKCGQVCPAGAIKRISPDEKKTVRAGHAEWNRSACIAAKETSPVNCTVCARHCPQKAITLVPVDRDNPSGPKIPVVDDAKCTGCGACEHLCPARPKPAMVVQGYTAQHFASRMPGDVRRPAESPVWAGVGLV